MNTEETPSHQLSGPQQKFAEGIVAGLTNTAAYMAAYPGAEETSAMSNAGRLIGNDEIQKEIARLRKLAEMVAGSAVMTLVETLIYLSDVVRTPVGQLTPDSPLTQEWAEDENAFGTKKKVKGCCKLKSLELLSRLTGRFQDTLKLDADKVVRVVIGE